MDGKQKFSKILILFGDIIILYLSFYLSVYLRSGFKIQGDAISQGIIPFSVLFVFWLAIFGINHLYELEYFKPIARFFKYLFSSVLINAVLAVGIFYFISWNGGFAPKIILFIFLLVSVILMFLWRIIISFTIDKVSPANVFFLGERKEIKELIDYLGRNGHLGYVITGQLKACPKAGVEEVKTMVQEKKIRYLIVDEALLKDKLEDWIFGLSQIGVDLIKVNDFYEQIFHKLSLDLLDESWFLDNFRNSDMAYYQVIKRMGDVIFALFLILITSPLWLIIAIAIKLDSTGSVFYTSERIGKGLKPFRIFKFRTMVKDAHKIGPVWTIKGDERITRVGRILRHWHLDELPQSINVLLGQLSIIGPRPIEKQEADEFYKKIQYCRLRNLIIPGVVGWAQLNHGYTSSIEDSIARLEYDLYYLKHRSLAFDLIIMFKALRIPFEVQSQ